jgi:hypothetical protein
MASDSEDVDHTCGTTRLLATTFQTASHVAHHRNYLMDARDPSETMSLQSTSLHFVDE